MPKIIANVKIDANVSEKIYLPVIEKLCGTYPLEKCGGLLTKNYVLLDRKPEKGLPVIEAMVEDSDVNIQFLFDVQTTDIKRRLYRTEEERPRIYKIGKVKGYAVPTRDYPDLDIHKIDSLYFETKRKLISVKDIEFMNWGEIERHLGIDASERPW